MTDFQQTLLRELTLFFGPLLYASSPQRRRELAATVGWDLDAIGGFPVGRIDDAIGALGGGHAGLVELSKSSFDSIDDFRLALETSGQFLAAVRDLGEVASGSFTKPPELDRIGAEIVELLFVIYLVAHHPTAYQLAVLLTLVEPVDPAAAAAAAPAVKDASTGEYVRFPQPRPRVRLDRLPDLLHDPVAVLREAYFGPAGLATEADARAAARKLFPRMVDLLHTLGVRAGYGADGTGTPVTGLGARMLVADYVLPVQGAAAGSSVGVAVALTSDDRGGAGAVIVPTATLRTDHDVGGWRLGVDVATTVAAVAVRAGGVTVSGPDRAGSLAVEIAATKAVVDGAAVRIGSTNGTRLELGELTLRAETALSSKDRRLALAAEAASGALVLAPGDGDGFLQEVLPKEGLRAEFELGIAWSTEKGLSFRGAAGLEATLPVKADLLGIARVDSVYLSLRPEDDAVKVVVAASATLTLGPVTAVVDRVGLDARLAFPPTGGNLGVADLAFDFKPPNGAAIKIDAGVVVGGGYLFFDPSNEQYSGVLQLELGGKISLKAIGLLTTRIPNSPRPGFSLLVIITAEGFAPIQLGMGFTLTGVGGLIGVNRTLNADALRMGIKTGVLDSLLFPRDPVRNAPAIVSAVNTVMPAAEHRYLLGPMVIISWGTPTILTLKLALVLEVPDPVRLAILGRISAYLPDEKNPVVRIQLDAIGLIDFQKGEVALDATLFDSRLLEFVLTGDMALRLSWGANPTFVLAIGGFNPRFPVPTGFPQLDRISLSLAQRDDLKLRLEAYVALTSNTVQFGARADLVALAGGFGLYGHLGFDALFQLSPFSFVVDVGAAFALKHGRETLFSVFLEAMLAGPTPWHVRGVARFEIVGLRVELPFDAQFGAGADKRELPPPVDVVKLLRDEIANRGNWSAELPQGQRPLVSVGKTAADGDLPAHPLAVLAVRQRVVPLNRRVTRFGTAVATGGPLFTVAVASRDGVPLPPPEKLTEAFAPAQFATMSDDEKLTAPAFEQMDAGLRFGSRSVEFDAALGVETPVEYETAMVDARAPAGVR